MTDLKIAIVGADASKWPIDSIPKVKQEINRIFTIEINNSISRGEHGHFVFISGGCPKGGVDLWAEAYADGCGLPKQIYKPEIDQWLDKHQEQRIQDSSIFQKGCVKCGAAFSYDMQQWIKDGKDIVKPCLVGYRSRNIQIVDACDVLYCISPKCPKCNGSGVYSSTDDLGGLSTNSNCEACKGKGYVWNGGVWTLFYLQKHYPNKKGVHIII